MASDNVSQQTSSEHHGFVAAQDDDDIPITMLPEHCADVSKQLAELFPITDLR